MLLHTGIKNHQCDVCNQMFCSRSNLLSHKAQSKCGAEEVVCPTCGKKCSNKYYLKRHIVRHTAERQFKCEFDGCGKSFFDQHVLKSHEKIHLGIKDFHCTLCPKQFTQSQQLSVHMKRHNGVMQVSDQNNLKITLMNFICHHWKLICRWKTTNVLSVEKLLSSRRGRASASIWDLKLRLKGARQFSTRNFWRWNIQIVQFDGIDIFRKDWNIHLGEGAK